MYCSIQQAVAVWDELRDAMEGKSGYGGKECKIYLYTLQPSRPGLHLNQNSEDHKEVWRRSAETLRDIIYLFEEMHKDATFEIALNRNTFTSPEDWIYLNSCALPHIAVVKCIKKRKAKK